MSDLGPKAKRHEENAREVMEDAWGVGMLSLSWHFWYHRYCKFVIVLVKKLDGRVILI